MIELEGYSPQPLPSILNIPRHFTASAVVISHDHILLVHHRRIGAWLPPGGHIEPDEMPHQCAEREVLEEAGIEIEVISNAQPFTGDSEAFILPAPLCVHSVKATEKGIDFYHIDFVFLARPKRADALPSFEHTDDVYEARWFPLAEMGVVPLAKNVVEVVGLALDRLRGK